MTHARNVVVKHCVFQYKGPMQSSSLLFGRTTSNNMASSYFTIFLLVIWANTEVYGHLCSDRNTKTLIKIPYIPYRGIDTCTHVADYSTYLTSLLDTCTFTTVAGVTESGTCHTECVTDDTCIGKVFSSANVCELCILTTGNGNGNSYAQADVMIVLEALNNHINGKHG